MEQARSTYWKSIVTCLAWLLIGFSFVMQYRMASDGDKNWLLYAAGRVLDGKRLYVDMTETNPPFIIWLYQIPVVLSRLFSMNDYHMLALCVLPLVAFSLYLCARLIALIPAFAENPSARSLHRLLLAAILLFWVNSVYFGDREHLFIICAMPYLLRFMPSLSKYSLPPSLKLSIGLLAGVGFCIKPHCLLIAVLVQCLCCLRDRSLRSLLRFENIMIAVGWLLYVAAIFIFTPDYVFAMLPMLLVTYGAYHNTLVSVFFYFPAILSLAFGFSEFRPRQATPFRADILYLLWLCAGMALYAYANNGWLYSLYPLNSLVMLAVGWAALAFAWQRKTAQGHAEPTIAFTRGIVACLIVILCNIAGTLAPYYLMFFGQPEESLFNKMETQISDVVVQTGAKKFGSLAMEAPLWTHLLRKTHTEFVTRFHSLWMYNKMVESDEIFRQQHEYIFAYVAHAFASDLTQNKPDLVFIDTSPELGFTKHHVDLIATLDPYADFAAAWSQYRFLQRIDLCNEVDKVYRAKPVAFCRYDVFARITPPK